jgi:hypothetical protein
MSGFSPSYDPASPDAGGQRVRSNSRLVDGPPLRTPGSRLLSAYFCSGWAFLIPYLAAYLLYAWMKWPVNPAAGGEEIVKGISESAQTLIPSFSHSLTPPPLLHVYWLLHVLTLALAIIALISWWRAPNPSESYQQTAWQRLYAVLPWLCLALLFWIPGVYLEFPADPWQHYARVNEWSWQQTVTQHSSWTKSSYFLAYSFIGHIAPPLQQLKWFDVYYTTCCLLLCWQYYRLARAIGLGERASMVFVVLQTLLFGNNVFGFYRYYGMSSSVFAQLGALALVRLALEAAKSPQLALRSFFSLPSAFAGRPARTITPAQAGGRSLGRQQATTGHTGLAAANNVVPPPTVYRLLLSCVLLLALTAFNHIQGLGIAALGMTAVVVWRLVEWRRSMIAWLALAAVVLSVATILWYPRHPALDNFYRPQGWLTAWYGFKLFTPGSQAFDRAASIIGLSGLINLVAGLFLIRRNHVVAWLTLVPVMALCLPLVVIPFTSILASRDVGEIITYSRVLFAIPAGLALVALGMSRLAADKETGVGDNKHGTQPWISVFHSSYTQLFAAGSVLILALFALTVTPASSPNFNRLYNTVMRVPADLSMHHVLQAIGNLDFKSAHFDPKTAFIANGGISFVTYSTGLRNVPLSNRSVFVSAITRTTSPEQSYLGTSLQQTIPAVFLPQVAKEVYTPLSLTAYLSRHWQSCEVALEFSSGPEAERMARELGYRKIGDGQFTYYFFTPK